MPDFQGLLSVTHSYLHDIDLSPLEAAYQFAHERHKDQLHASGDPYLRHLVDVATTLSSMHLDLVSIVAGLLHGTLRDNVATLEELEERFGPDVANIVHGATKITHVRYDSSLAHQAENIRRLFLAMSTDIRVLLLEEVHLVSREG